MFFLRIKEPQTQPKNQPTFFKLNGFKLNGARFILFFTAFGLIFGSFGLSSVANAQKSPNDLITGFVVTPALYELEADRGSSYDIAINLLNDSGADDYKVGTLLQSFQASKDEGVPIIAELPSDSKYLSWITFQETSFTIKKSEQAVSHIRVEIPKDAEPGSHYLALTYLVNNANQTDQDQNTGKPRVKIEPRVAVMLFLNVKGQIQRDASFEYIKADKDIYDPFFDGAKIDYRLNVTGNSYLKPNGNIFIGDESKPDASLTLNPENKIILPNSSRSFKMRIAPKINIPYLSTGQIESDPTMGNVVTDLNHPWFGNQKVETRLLFVNSQNELTQRAVSVNLFYFPWKTLLVLSPILLILGFLGLWVYRKKRL